MRLLITFAALLGSVILLQLSSGAISPLDALGGIQQGFTRAQVGMLGSAHFLGFFIGCWWAPRLMGRVGHSRAFAAFAASGAIGAIAHPLLIEPTAWALMRVMTGLCVAGCYTVIEAWLHASVTNETRGQVLGAYRSADLLASMGAQLLIGFLEPAVWVSYNLLAILCCASLIPMTVTQRQQPVTAVAPKLRPLKTLRVSPLGGFGVIIAGVTTSSFRMVGPLYGQEVGLQASQIGYFLAAFVLGGALAQMPIGYLADRYDRRWVLIALSLLAVGASAGTVAYGAHSEFATFAAALLFGLVTFPVFSVSTAHANDFSAPEDAVELSASLMFLYGVGAIASPLSSSMLIENFGPSALFVFIAVAHVLLALFGLLRMMSRPTAGTRTPYRYIPRTTFILGRMFRRNRSRDRRTSDRSGTSDGSGTSSGR